jgi:hypothetical protein
MQHEDIAKIKERIAKLLRMAQDSSSPNEAAIAANRARSLMDKYQIGEADLDSEIHDVFGTERYGRNYKNIPTYMNILAVARFNDCRVTIGYDPDWQETNRGKKAARCGPNCNRFIKFMGYKNDVTLAAAMMDSLVSCMDALCKAYLVGRGHTGRYPRDIGEAFKIGCSSELTRRINELTRERNELMEVAAQTSPGTAIAIIDKKKRVDEEFGEQRTKNTRTLTAYDGSTMHATEAGRNEGRKIEIQPKMET